MNKNKQIISYCKNFYKIINFDYFEDDFISSKLIEIYNNYIFSIDLNNSKEIDKIIELDRVIAKYIDDYIFRREMKNVMLNLKVKAKQSNLLEVIVNNILYAFDIYESKTLRNIYVSRWI